MLSVAPGFSSKYFPASCEVIHGLLNSETLKKIAAKLDVMPNGETWYSEIYDKAIYGPMVFRDQELRLVEMVEQVLPEYRILADLYLEKTSDDQGFPFHTDFDSIGFMERPEDMLTVWIPLTPVQEAGSGQLSIVMEEGAVRLSLIREANQLHSLLRIVDPSVPAHQPFQSAKELADRLHAASLGVATAVDASKGVKALLSEADAAMYKNKLARKAQQKL